MSTNQTKKQRSGKTHSMQSLMPLVKIDKCKCPQGTLDEMQRRCPMETHLKNQDLSLRHLRKIIKKQRIEKSGPRPRSLLIKSDHLRTPAFIEEKGFVSFKGNKKIRFHTDSPGPCAYQPTVPFPSKKFSFQRSKPHQKMQQKPSPATYNLRETKNNGLSFPKEERNLTPQKQKILFPGPGQYESSKGFSHKKDFSFTKTKKFFASNHQSEQKEAIPGPAAYQISKSRGAIKSTKFAKAIRAFLQDDKIPGPGSYHIQRSSLLHQGGIIASQKRAFEYDNQVPGPGNYKQVPVNLVKKKEAVVIINRSRDSSPSQKKNIPGPGAYFSEKKPKEKIVGGVIGRQLRNNINKVTVPNFNATKILFRQQGAPLTGVKPQTSDDGNMRKNHSFQIHKKRLNPTDNGIRQTAQPALAE